MRIKDRENGKITYGKDKTEYLLIEFEITSDVPKRNKYNAYVVNLEDDEPTYLCFTDKQIELLLKGFEKDLYIKDNHAYFLKNQIPETLRKTRMEFVGKKFRMYGIFDDMIGIEVDADLINHLSKLDEFQTISKDLVEMFHQATEIFNKIDD